MLTPMVDRVFLGWDRPFLTRAADWLLDRPDTLPHLLVVVPTSQAGRRLREALAERAGFDPHIEQVAPQISSVVNLVAAELGLSIVPASISQVQVDGVRYVDIQGDAPHARLALATRAQERNVIVRNFADLALRPPR